MGRDLSYRPGSFYRVDDRTGFPQRAERTKKQWNGIIVDETVWEARQPQDLVKGVKDNQNVPEARPLAPNVFVGPTFTQLGSDPVVGQTVLDMASTAGFYVGVEVSVMLDNGVLFFTSVSAVGAGTITIATPLPYSAAPGNLVTNYHRAGVAPPPLHPPVNISAPVISGPGAVGSTGTVTNGTWTNSPTSFAIQWKRNGGAIGGATGASYLYVNADAGQDITATVTATNTDGSGSANSNTITPVQPGAPVNTVAPAITGAGVVGSLATVSNGTWTNVPTSFARQWKRNGVAIGGATAATYTYVDADVGQNITATVTATNSAGSAAANSNTVVPAQPGVPVNTVAPQITGAGIIGTTAVVGTGTWTNAPTGYAYVWKRNGTAIGGATAAIYVYVEADADQNITAVVTATNGIGSASAGSNTVVPLQPAAPGNLVAPAITGSTVQGSTGTLSLGSWSHSPTSYTAQWFRGATPIGGATGFTYTYVALDVGENITGKVTAFNDVGSTTATSNTVVPTAPPSGIPVHNADELYTALNTATGGEVFLCDAHTDFLDALFPAGKDFTSNPVTVQCQAGTVFNSIFIGNFKGATINGGNIYGSYAGVNAGLMIQNGSAHITTNGLTSNTGDPDGTQHGNGIQIRDSSFITINGQNNSTKIDVSGRGQGVALIDSSDINLSGLTFKNVEVDEIDIASVATAHINSCLGWDKWPQVGDHPDFVQAFGTNSDITIQNSGWEQKGGGGEFGGASQGITFEGTHTNTVISTCWVLGGLTNTFQISGGSNATVQVCFAQGFLTYGSRIIARDGTVDCTVTDCTAVAVTNLGGNPGFSESGTIHVSDVAGTHTDLDIWLAAHPTARARP